MASERKEKKHDIGLFKFKIMINFRLEPRSTIRGGVIPPAPSRPFASTVMSRRQQPSRKRGGGATKQLDQEPEAEPEDNMDLEVAEKSAPPPPAQSQPQPKGKGRAPPKGRGKAKTVQAEKKKEKGDEKAEAKVEPAEEAEKEVLPVLTEDVEKMLRKCGLPLDPHPHHPW